MAHHVSVRHQQAIAVVEISNPPANALSAAVLAHLREVVSELGGRPDIRAVVFSGAGTVSFLSGADLTEMPALLADGEALAARMREVGELFEQVERLPQVTIAAVGASAMGGGLEFALVCDLVVASERAKFAFPEVKLGLIPGAGGTQRLVRRIPVQRAREMLLLGSALGSGEALALGLVNQVCGQDKVLQEAVKLASQVADLPRVAVQSAKRAVRAGMARPLDEGLQVERSEFLRVAGTGDAREGPAAFLERRPPSFAHQ